MNYEQTGSFVGRCYQCGAVSTASVIFRPTVRENGEVEGTGKNTVTVCPTIHLWALTSRDSTRDLPEYKSKTYH
jgi:hypothetical protein